MNGTFTLERFDPDGNLVEQASFTNVIVTQPSLLTTLDVKFDIGTRGQTRFFLPEELPDPIPYPISVSSPELP